MRNLSFTGIDMAILAAALTDKGPFRKVNQDSYCLRVASAAFGQLAFAVVCDGMGGLTDGEYASASVTLAFANWFDNEFFALGETPFPDGFAEIAQRWNEIIREQNALLLDKGRQIDARLGTTCSAILLAEGAGFVIAHVGDTRIYRIAKTVERLTEDHTAVADEVRKGLLTEAEGARDSRRNILSQCIGANDYLNPLFLRSVTPPSGWHLLCTDGFWHEISENEMRRAVYENAPKSEEDALLALRGLADVCIKRGETDNITALLLKA